MFGKLRDKLKSFLGKPAEEDKKEEKKVAEAPKKEKKEKKVEKKVEKKEARKKTEAKEKTQKSVEKETEEKVPAEEIEKKTQTEKQNEEPEEKPQKKGFLKKLFTSSEEEKPTEEKTEKESELEKVEEKKAEKEEGFLKKFTKRLGGEVAFTQEHVDEIFEELELILVENNVALEVVDKIRENLSENLVGTEVKKEKMQEKIIDSLKESINEVLLEPPNLIETIKNHKGTYTIVFFGINGSGKTTSIAKLAHKLKKEGISCVLAAGDTFRAAAIQQLETHAERLGVPIIKHDYNADPTAVAFDAKKYAEKNNIKVALIDTAGRMYTKENLVKQMEKIIRVIQPELKVFVGESITGNDATEQARTFNDAVGIDGIILSKADVDEKGGTALSVSYITQAPIYFLGVGQSYDDLEVFEKQKIMKGLGLE